MRRSYLPVLAMAWVLFFFMIVIALTTRFARAADAPIAHVDLTADEVNFIDNILDAATKSGGMAPALMAVPIHHKLKAAWDKAIADANEAALNAKIDAAKAEAVKAAKPPEPAPTPAPEPAK